MEKKKGRILEVEGGIGHKGEIYKLWVCSDSVRKAKAHLKLMPTRVMKRTISQGAWGNVYSRSGEVISTGVTTSRVLRWSPFHIRKMWEMGLFNLKKRRLGWDLIHLCKYFKGGCEEDAIRLFQVVPSDRTRGNWHKLKQSRLCLNIKKYFFTVRVTEDWNRLLRSLNPWSR